MDNLIVRPIAPSVVIYTIILRYLMSYEYENIHRLGVYFEQYLITLGKIGNLLKLLEKY